MTTCSFSRLRGLGASAFAACFLVTAAAGCTAQATRGGVGTERPDMDRPAMSVSLDRDDITYMVDDYLHHLEASAFWQQTVHGAAKMPVVAIAPIQNNTTQHLDDQMLTLLSSIETALVNTNRVTVVDRQRQDALYQELRDQHAPMFDPATVQRFGRMLGVKYIFTGKITSVDERLNKVRRVQYSLFLQVIEVETGAIRFQGEVTRSKQLKG